MTVPPRKAFGPIPDTAARLRDDCEAWLLDNMAYFATTEIRSDGPDDVMAAAALKRFSEVSILSRFLRQEAPDDTRAALIAMEVRALAPDGDTLCRSTRQMPGLLLICLLIAQETGDVAAVAALHALSSDSAELRCCERLPMEHVMIASILAYHGLAPLQPPEDVVSRLLVHAHPELSEITSHSGYVICHDLFFLSNWGRMPDCLDDDVRAGLPEFLVRQFVHAYELARYDLAFEFVIALQCIGAFDEAGACIGQFDDLPSVRSENAAYDLPIPRILRPHVAGSPESRDAEFLRFYHTVIVLLLCLAVQPAS